MKRRLFEALVVFRLRRFEQTHQELQKVVLASSRDEAAQLALVGIWRGEVYALRIIDHGDAVVLDSQPTPITTARLQSDLFTYPGQFVISPVNRRHIT